LTIEEVDIILESITFDWRPDKRTLTSSVCGARTKSRIWSRRI